MLKKNSNTSKKYLAIQKYFLTFVAKLGKFIKKEDKTSK